MYFIYYFYKITNLINHKYYYGVHKQHSDKKDTYMGSGSLLQKDIKKYGIKNFSKEIIKYFNCEKDMYDYEHNFVSREFLRLHKNECYNRNVGGYTFYMKLSEEAREEIRHNQRGYTNADFVKRWLPLYEKYKDVFIELELYSNLSDNVIINCLFKKQRVKIYNLLKYYIYNNYLPSIKKIIYTKEFISDNFESRTKCSATNSRKTIFENTKIKYNFIFKQDKFFELLDKFINLSSNMDLSDSMICHNTLKNDEFYISGYFSLIDYFSRLGIIYNIKKIKIKGKGIERVRLATKTIFDVDFNRINKTLIDKEFNIYELNEYGRPVQKGKFKLEINGKKYSLRYK